MTEGVDYAWGRPGGAALKANGKHFAMRYVPYNGDGGKGLTLSEKQDLLSHDIQIGMVFETFAARAKDGYAAGQNDAKLAIIGMNNVNMPSGMPIYFAVDFDANVGQRTYDNNVAAQLKSYFDGVASVIGRNRTGIYGSIWVVDWALTRGVASWGWQTYAWSGGRVSTRAHLIQYNNYARINGAAVDLNRSLKFYFGQIPTPDSIPDTGTAEPTSRGFLMAIPKRFRQAKHSHRYVVAFKPLRAEPHLNAKVFMNTKQRTKVKIWGYVIGDSVGGSKIWYFGPKWDESEKRNVVFFTPQIDTRDA